MNLANHYNWSPERGKRAAFWLQSPRLQKATKRRAETTVDAALSSAAAGIISGGVASSAAAETCQSRYLFSRSPPNLLVHVHPSRRERAEEVSGGVRPNQSLEEAREPHLEAEEETEISSALPSSHLLCSVFPARRLWSIIWESQALDCRLTALIRYSQSSATPFIINLKY